MKLLLLHGAAIDASRARLINLKKTFDPNSIIVFDQSADKEIIEASLITPALLSEERLVILENPSEDMVFDSPFVNFPLSIILWFDHEVSPKKKVFNWVNKFNGQSELFEEDREISIFPFLDALADGNKKAFLDLDKLKRNTLTAGFLRSETTRHGFEIHYLITMIFYLLRNLTVTPKTAPAFVKQKLERQRKRFDLEKIKNLYKQILEIDFKLKSGLLEGSHAEFLLVNLFTH